MTKVAVNTVTSVIVLLVMAGCDHQGRKQWLEASENEIVQGFRARHSQGYGMWSIERKEPQTPKIRDVISLGNGCVLQVYRIEDRTVTQCYFLTIDPDRGNTVGKVLEKVRPSAWEVIEKLPNVLKPDWIPPPVPENHPVFSIVDMRTLPNPSFEPSPDEVAWGWNWYARKWAGATNEVSAEVETLCQHITHEISLPENARHYPSYLRVVPLLTKEDVECEKDTPIIDLRKTRYYVREAFGNPYTLFPVHDRKSPFPVMRKYTPGDKFKVREEWEGQAYYYLIETFAGM